MAQGFVKFLFTTITMHHHILRMLRVVSQNTDDAVYEYWDSFGFFKYTSEGQLGSVLNHFLVHVL
jgi:hypothetical protein